MTSPNRFAKAYVEITADYDKFAREATTKLNQAFREIGGKLNTDDIGRKAGTDFGDSFAKGAESVVANRFQAVGRNAVVGLAAAVDGPDSRNRFGSALRNLVGTVTSSVGKFFSNFGSGFGDKLTEALGPQTMSRIATGLRGAAAGLGQFLIQAGIMVIVLPHLAGVVVTLTANLVGLAAILFLLPGTIAVLLGALIPLVIVFQNFGGALSAIMEGDPEKIAEAMDKLAPSARRVAKEFALLLPWFREVQKIAQNAFFAQLTGQLTSFFDTIGKARISQGLENVSAALGRFVGLLFRVGESPGFQRLGDLLFGNAQDSGGIARILDRLAPSLERLMEAFATVAATTLPTLEKVFAAMGGGINRFAMWLEAAAADGRLQEWLDKGLQTAGDLKDLLGEMLALLGTIFDQTDDGGERFLQKITKAVADLRAYFESPEGKEALTTMVHLANNFADALGYAVDLLEKILTLLAMVDIASGRSPSSRVKTGKSAGVAGQVQAVIAGYAEGGVINKPTFALMGEAGPEAVVPLSDPTRARQVMAEAGLLPLAENMSSGGMTVLVYLGTDQITDILDTRVERGLSAAGRQLRHGPRGM